VIEAPIPRYLKIGEVVPIGTKLRILDGPWWLVDQTWFLKVSDEVEVINEHGRYWRSEEGWSLHPAKGFIPIDGQSEWVTVRWVERIWENSFVMRRVCCYRSGEWLVTEDEGEPVVEREDLEKAVRVL
jgi:hypothetical protein